MYPVLFEIGPVTIYAYGFFIAIGALSGFMYMARQSKAQFGLSYDHSNTLFLLLVSGGVVGGKLFALFEDPSFYFSNPAEIFARSGFVFYGSLLTCIPIMLWYFRKNHIPVWTMLDIIAVTTCILHGFGRIGCFMAGCCYGVPTHTAWGVTFSNPACLADPLNTPLHPTQLYEASLIFLILAGLLLIKNRKRFEGQLFLIYLMTYAAGRSIIEIFRGDGSRGYVIPDILSIAQLISLALIALALYFYVKRRNLNLHNKPLAPWKTKVSDKK